MKESRAKLRVVPLERARAIERDALAKLYFSVRRATEHLCATLETEDLVIQTMPDVSPTKWHLGHTSWFFETFVLAGGLPGYSKFDARFAYVFNSYYHSAGDRHPRAERGLLSRPTVPQVFEYRHHVDAAMARVFEELSARALERLAFAIELGINHEEQHQELMLTDIKHVLAANPLEAVYRPGKVEPPGPTAPLGWEHFKGGLVDIGDAANAFAFDNERPRHPVYLEAFELADRPVTCGEYLSFVEDGGYQRAELWLSDGWDAVQQGGWRAPLYWRKADGQWRLFTLGGVRALEASQPVCHVSYYEADAFARWAGARLPREEEWELATAGAAVEGNCLESGRLHPTHAPCTIRHSPRALFGDVWEWTASAYLPYPGFIPFIGGFGEYNGKFMSNKMVLRGGSCATPRRHIRATYRNFLSLDARWQFSGIRLARSA